MMESAPGTVTQLLMRFREGDRDVEDELFRVMYSEMHRLAARYLRDERIDHTLQPTALINEAFIRLIGQRQKDWANRSHFVAVAAQIMRRILVDSARRVRAAKRGSGQVTVPIADDSMAPKSDAETILQIDVALDRLAKMDARQTRIVELRYFAGFSEEETAELLNVSPRTVRREWALARAWLHGELTATRG